MPRLIVHVDGLLVDEDRNTEWRGHRESGGSRGLRAGGADREGHRESVVELGFDLGSGRGQ